MLLINHCVILPNNAVLKVSTSILLLLSLSFSSLSLADRSASDPFEKINRVSFWVTDQADRFVIRPVAMGYTKITPNWVEDRVRHFFDNLGEVTSVPNSLLQLKFDVAGRSAGRFLINSSIGMGGFFDVAKKWGIYRQAEDFGQTLGHWGVPSGPYLFIPLLGPSSVRDAVALVVDSPWRMIPYIDHVPTRNGVLGFQIIDARGRLLEYEAFIMGDKYTFMRDFYLNHRIKQVADGTPDLVFEEDDFDDEFDDEFDED